MWVAACWTIVAERTQAIFSIQPPTDERTGAADEGEMMRRVSSVLLGAALAACGQYKDLTVSADHTSAVVAYTTGQVSESFLFYLVNSGQQQENVEHGVDSSSSGTTWTLGSISNPVGPGQTTYPTVTMRGTGGLFPYWMDYWAQIQGAPETKEVVRLTIDTLSSSAVPGNKQTAGVAPGGSGNRTLRVTVTLHPSGQQGQAVDIAGRTANTTRATTGMIAAE